MKLEMKLERNVDTLIVGIISITLRACLHRVGVCCWVKMSSVATAARLLLYFLINYHQSVQGAEGGRKRRDESEMILAAKL